MAHAVGTNQAHSPLKCGLDYLLFQFFSFFTGLAESGRNYESCLNTPGNAFPYYSGNIRIRDDNSHEVDCLRKVHDAGVCLYTLDLHGRLVDGIGTFHVRGFENATENTCPPFFHGIGCPDYGYGLGVKDQANAVNIRVMCSSRVDPVHILEAFKNGADGVFIGGCHPGDCHYQTGNYKTRKRMMMLRELIAGMGISPERLRLEWISASEGPKFAQVMHEMRETIKELGPLEWSTERQTHDVAHMEPGIQEVGG